MAAGFQRGSPGSGEGTADQRRKNLSYTQVTSPVNGVMGKVPFRVGSLVSPSMTTPLTTVSDISEMYAYFSMTEKQLTRPDPSGQHFQ